VVFRVGGLLALKAPLRITEPYLTIAGQTAPGDGICLRNYDVAVTNSHDIVIRHLRVRPGDVSRKELDGLSVYRSRDVILDHCSVSWSTDETLSVTGEGCGNVTVQWCMITESLNESVHQKGSHGYGSLIRTDGGITYHHNLYAHHVTRCPRPGTYGNPRGILLDFRNNVIYDWVSPAGYSAEDRATLNYVGNYLRPGPSTKDRRYAFKVGGPATLMFVAGNRLEGRDESDDPWDLIARAEPGNRSGTPFDVAATATDPAARAFDRVLDRAGATAPGRDAVDLRVIEQVRSGRGRVINSQDDVGGWPTYASGTPPADEDRDGMPDAWERGRGLDPANPSDARGDRDADGYTNLEEFLNQIAVQDQG
jgi:pectate lyase